MSIQVTCDCGFVTRVDDAAAGGSVECGGCGKILSVPWMRSPHPAAPPRMPPMVRPGPIAVAQPRPSMGLGIASMVCGICSLLFGVCLAPVSLIVGTASVIMGVVCLAKKLGGRGMAVAGVVTGGIGVLVGLVFLAIPLLVFTSAARMRPAPVAMAPKAVVSADPGGRVPPPVLTGGVIADMLTGPLDLAPNAARAETELRKALAAYRRRRTDDLYLYECVQNFRRHLAYAGKRKLEEAEHQEMFRQAGDELVDKVLEKYEEAGEFQQDGKWPQAIQAYREILRLVPERNNAFCRNVAEHISYCQRRMAEPKDGEDR